jgi:hypothetical protein
LEQLVYRALDLLDVVVSPGHVVVAGHYDVAHPRHVQPRQHPQTGSRPERARPVVAYLHLAHLPDQAIHTVATPISRASAMSHAVKVNRAEL